MNRREIATYTDAHRRYKEGPRSPLRRLQMVNEKTNKYENLPIPTYEEATSSRPTSAQSHVGVGEASSDAERQGLLGRNENETRLWRNGQNGYQRPTVESARSSLESEDFLPSSAGISPRSSVEGLRQEMVEMEVLDPLMDGAAGSSRIRNQISKRITSLTNTLSSIHLPFQFRFPSFNYIRSRLPENRTVVLVNVGRFLALIFVLLLVYALFVSDIFPVGRTGTGQPYDPESVRAFVQGNVDENRIRDYLERLTAHDHVAGTEGDYILAKWVEEHFATAGLDQVELKEYQVYLNYPRASGRRVAVVHPPEMAWEARLEEESASGDPNTYKKQTFVFHGHSRAGNVTGPLVYANYGSREDFRELADSGIEVKGAIALVRHYGTQGDRALKVKAAEMAGAVGCIIYSDPMEDGFRRGDTWPTGRWMPSDGVQRGAVSLMSWIVGDVLTPGWASTKDAKRISKEGNPGLVNIPSLPLAWRDAQRLLQVLKNHGRKVPTDWVGGVPDVEEWWSGDQTSPLVHLSNLQDEEERQPVWNVIGRITGLEQKEKQIIIGNHRDAWCLGGSDPGSGTAILLEVVRIFGKLVGFGWRPLRTIVFANWDGEEYNLIGSTEWVEDNVQDLRQNGMGYINLDAAVTGSEFHASASPLFQSALLHVLGRIIDPMNNRTLRSLWDENGSQLQGLGAGSDYVAFQDISGTSSLDMSFDGPGFPYHSCYDNFEWMKKFGDPDFQYHKVLAQVLALLILELSDRQVLPYDFKAYAFAVKGYANDLEAYAKEQMKGEGGQFDAEPLQGAADQFIRNAKIFQDWEQEWSDVVYGSVANFETHLLDLEEGGGLLGREQFKHIIFAPQAWSGYDTAYFPAVRDALDQQNWSLAQQQLDKAAAILNKATDKLLH
ncbi:hypothetical protein FGG08_002924 [Glutinoglossum americanum]|uniref:Glutamate carboxypeptidase Tre2 n=1 Tax=Glutinoglossum americanum TaxID=1670608 RepID=A0A9P8KYP4_9PEZI|nr:hypothetical protein FGG08_002924 [Glutinoglossum americanum]